MAEYVRSCGAAAPASSQAAEILSGEITKNAGETEALCVVPQKVLRIYEKCRILWEALEALVKRGI